MSTSRIDKALANIDDELIAEALEYKHHKNRWIKWGVVAACFLAIAVTGVLLFTKAPSKKEKNEEITISFEANARIWPLEYQTDYEKYRYLELEGIKYEVETLNVPEKLIGDKLGAFSIIGIDEFGGFKEISEKFEVYAVKEVDKSELVAARMKEGYFVFIREEYRGSNKENALLVKAGISDFAVKTSNVTGKIVEITDEYFVIDDSVICQKNVEPKTYKILLNDLKINRYVVCDEIKLGDIVQVSFTGTVDEAHENSIDSAYMALKAIIYRGGVYMYG